MGQLFYTEIRADIRNDFFIQIDSREAAQLVTAAVHSANSALPEARRLAIAFPSLVDGDTVPTAVVRVMGPDIVDLEKLLTSAQFRTLSERGVRVRAPAPVQDHAASAAFIRQRSGEAKRPGAAARAFRRAERKAAERVARGESDVVPPLRMADRKTSESQRAGILLWMRSSSTERAFPMLVDLAEPGECAINAFGLSAARGTGIGRSLPHWPA